MNGGPRGFSLEIPASAALEGAEEGDAGPPPAVRPGDDAEAGEMTARATVGSSEGLIPPPPLLCVPSLTQGLVDDKLL
jgi:hypothetical protein